MFQRQLLAAGLALFLAGTAGAGEPAPPVKAPSKIDPEAAKALGKVGDYYAGLKSLSVEIFTESLLQAGDKQRSETVAGLLAARSPNLFAFTFKHKISNTEVVIVSDGKKLSTSVSTLKKYTVTEAPADFDQLLADEGLTARLIGPADAGFLTALLRPKGCARLTQSVEAGELLAPQEIDGARCRRLRFAEKDLDWEMWVEDGERPLVRKIVVDQSKGIARLPDAPPGLKATMTISFKKWAVNAELPDALFAFTEPPGAKLAKSFEEEEEPSPLLGKPAPDFELVTLDGGKTKLSDLKGKSVVILDFWATWCPPCRKSLPVIVETAKTYKGKGVALYAVNQQEDEETIKGFQEKQKLQFPVALDPEGAIGEAYGVKGIPQTVIIGKDGTVQAVHVGALPDLQERLAKELDTLLAGKKLVEDSKPENPLLPAGE